MKKLLFTDIDGTLLRDDKSISDKNLKAIRKFQSLGSDIVLCSGRSDISMRLIDQNINSSRYLVSCNGALVVDKLTDTSIYEDDIDKTYLEELYNYAEENHLTIYFNTLNSRYTNDIDLYNNPDEEFLYKKIDGFDYNCYQVVLITKDYNQALKLREYLNNFEDLQVPNMSIEILLYKIRNNADYYFFDITNKGVSKGKAISKLLEYLNIDKKDTAAIGDHMNDLSMKDAVDIMFSVDSGYRELKRHSDFIVSSNNEDGFSEAVEYLIRGD